MTQRPRWKTSNAREEQQHESQDDLPRDWPDDGQVGGHERTIGATLEQQNSAVVLPVKADGHRPGGLAHHAGLFAQDESELGSQ